MRLWWDFRGVFGGAIATRWSAVQIRLVQFPLSSIPTPTRFRVPVFVVDTFWSFLGWKFTRRKFQVQFNCVGEKKKSSCSAGYFVIFLVVFGFFVDILSDFRVLADSFSEKLCYIRIWNQNFIIGFVEEYRRFSVFFSADFQKNRASTHHHINTSTHQHFNTSTHQHINTSTHQHINTSTHQHTNTSTHQHSHQHVNSVTNTSTHQHINTSTHLQHTFNTSTLQHININTSTHQHFNTSTHQHINTSTHQHINTSTQSSTHQHINTSTHQHINSPTHQHLNTSTHQHINSSTPQHINTPTHQHINSPTHQVTTHHLRSANCNYLVIVVFQLSWKTQEKTGNIFGQMSYLWPDCKTRKEYTENWKVQRKNLFALLLFFLGCMILWWWIFISFLAEQLNFNE